MRFLKMPGCLPNSPQETVRYTRNDTVEEDAEMIISSSIEEDQSSEKDKSPQLKICFYGASIVITLMIFFVALGVLYHSTNTLQGSLVDSCVPVQRIKKVIVETEQTDLKSCSDNSSCHSFLDVIEQKHSGLKYNFVIGDSGVLYIGSGFKCLANSEKNALYVKMLRFKKIGTREDYLKMCFRLSEIINHGVSCGKISPEYETQGEEICSILESGKNKSYHVHDPDQEVKLIHGNFGWTFCGNFSSTLNMEKNKVITMDSFSKNSCLPLQNVERVIVDIVETPPYNCSDDDELSCLRLFEEHHEGFNFNFIIGHTGEVYVGLGFDCTAQYNKSNILIIKVMVNLRDPYHNILENHRKVIQIISEGIKCGIISDEYSKEINCSIVENSICDYYQNRLGYIFWADDETETYKVRSKHDRVVVPQELRIQLCHRDPITLSDIYVGEEYED